MATRSAISSQWAIIASCTALKPSMSIMPRSSAAVRSGTHSIVTSSIASRPPKPVRSGGVADVVGRRDLHVVGHARCHRDRLTLRALVQLHRAAAADLLDGDQLRLGLDLGGDVVGALAQRDVVERLLDLLAALDDELELVVVLAGLGWRRRSRR